MSTSTLTATRVRVLPPSTVRPRGALLVVPGRGENLVHYGRFAQRIAADGYVVDVLDALPADATEVGELLAEIDAEESAIEGPRILVGVDAGAAVVVDAVRQGLVSPSAILLAGAVVGESVSTAVDVDDEIAQRTSCPVHRGLLGEDPRYTRSLGEATDASRAWGTSVASREPSGTTNGPWYVGIPVLAVHGHDDEVSSLRDVVRALSWWPDAELLAVRDGVHDVLNDAAHRTVAASVASGEPSGTSDGPWYVGIPLLALHGHDDEVAPLRDLVRALSWWPDAELLTVRDGVHDVLNDAAHRSVAASVVQFLERVRSGNTHRSIVVRVPLGNSVEQDGTGI